MRRRREGNVAFAAQQPGRGIEADPAGAGNIDFGPGMQVGEIGFGAGGAFDRQYVRPKLDEIAGDEAGRQADVPHDLHQQPCRIAAGPGAGGERFLRRLHARLHAHEIADRVLQAHIEFDQKVDGVARLARNRSNEVFQQRPGRLRLDKGREILVLVGRKFERPLIRIGLDEKVERIDDLHVRAQIDGDGEFAGLLRKDVARQPVAVGSCCQFTKCWVGVTVSA